MEDTKKGIIEIKGIDNQNTVAQILFENGYTVRKVTVQKPNSKTKTVVIEYWKSGEKS